MRSLMKEAIPILAKEGIPDEQRLGNSTHTMPAIFYSITQYYNDSDRYCLQVCTD